MSDPEPPPDSAPRHRRPDVGAPTGGPVPPAPRQRPAHGEPSVGAAQGAPPSRPYHAFPAHRPTHPRAVPAMVLGLVGLSGVFCLVPFALSPLAWYYGAVARREAQRDEGAWAPSPFATAGVVTGAIGTVMLIFGTAALVGVALVTWLVTGATTGYEQ